MQQHLSCSLLLQRKGELRAARMPAKEDVWMTFFTVSLLLATDERTF